MISVLISLKEKILRKCDGSPQAIVILAGLLSTRNLTEWSSVIEHEFLEENILASCRIITPKREFMWPTFEDETHVLSFLFHVLSFLFVKVTC